MPHKSKTPQTIEKAKDDLDRVGDDKKSIPPNELKALEKQGLL